MSVPSREINLLNVNFYPATDQWPPVNKSKLLPLPLSSF